MDPRPGTTAPEQPCFLHAQLLGSVAGLLAFRTLARSLGPDVSHPAPHRIVGASKRMVCLDLGRARQSDRQFPPPHRTHHAIISSEHRRDVGGDRDHQGCRVHGGPTFFSTTLHRKWRQWLDERFNRALLDSNHTHFHLQQNGFGAATEDESSSPDNIDQRIQEAIKGMTGGAIGLGVGIAGVVLSLGFVGRKLIETSSPVRGLDLLGSYGSACLMFLAIAIYVPLNTFIAAKLGSVLQGLSIRIQSAEGSYRSELNQLLHRSFHVAVIKGEPAQKAVNGRRYREIDDTWASLNRVTAGYMGFELVHNFIGSRIVAYAPGLLPYVDKTISLQDYVTGAELATALINECSWFIHAMPDIATLRADARRITELAQAIETVQRPQDYYARSGPSVFEYETQDAARGLTIQAVELLHTGDDKAFLTADELNFRPGSGPWWSENPVAERPRFSRPSTDFGHTAAA